MRSSTSRKLSLESLERRALLTTFFVDGAAAGGGDGSADAPFATIQEGVDAAAVNDGADTVKVHAGTYQEHLEINDTDGLRIQGLPSATIESPDSEDNVISILAGDVTLQKLIIPNGRNGIVATGDSLRLHDVDVRFSEGIIDDEGDAVGGHGVVATEMDSVEVLRGDYVGSTVVGNAEDGLDIDDTAYIILIGVRSLGNGFDDPEDPGSGLQVEAEDDLDTQLLLVIGSVFSGNAADGIQISEPDDDKRVLRVDLRAVTVSDNSESGLDIDIMGTFNASAVTSTNNGEPDSIITG